MKTYRMQDTDGGNEALVIAENIFSAVEKYQEAFGYGPEDLRELTADGEIVLFAIKGEDIDSV